MCRSVLLDRIFAIADALNATPRDRSWRGQYRELGYMERLVAWAFVLIYIVEIMRQVIR